MRWPTTREELVDEQRVLAASRPAPWVPGRGALAIGGCFVCFPRGISGRGAAGDRSWAAAAVIGPDREVVTAVVVGRAGAPYSPGLLALREGPLLELAVHRLPMLPDVLLVNATGRDHPRGGGLAIHLGAILEIPTVGVTDRPLVAVGELPELRRGAQSPLSLAGERVGSWLCSRGGARPLVVHAGWRTDPDTAVAVVTAAIDRRGRTPAPIRHARRAARSARAADAGRSRSLV